MEAGALPIGTAIVHGRERAKNTDMQYKSIFLSGRWKCLQPRFQISQGKVVSFITVGIVDASADPCY